MSEAIAIVGMSLRVPGAATPTEFWNNLAAGIESITTLSEEQLTVAGVSRDAMRRPGYVRRAATLDRMEWFDAEFFGFSPKDAAIMDPQHRQFLTACWEALEDAAHPASTFDGSIGVFGGCGMGSYLACNLLSNQQLVDDVGLFLLRHTGNDKDFLVTRASYLLDLQGPAVNVQTACSTSLVATHLAVQNLLHGECDLALAGGVTIEIPHGRGYQYQSGEILSPDGHCRAFDADASGTVFGSGVGVVVLRRLSEAIADGDHIYAVVRGTAVNNDGARKVGYLAPSVDGQAACIAEALAVAEVPATTVQFVECHGTGTAMGDPIEIAALDQAFGRPADGTSYCQIGSVKTNIGHLDTAAGAASLIKASLALHNNAIPPSLHYQRANPNSVLDGSAFRVATELTNWPSTTGTPRRAGVNSLGVGGTNAFAVLEEAPSQPSSTAANGAQLLVLSARNRAALDGASERLARHLEEHPELNLADVAHTLHVGRHQFSERRVVAATSIAEATHLLRNGDARRVFTNSAGVRQPPIVFLFPGGGTQYPRMAAQLYDAEPTFRRQVEDGLRLAQDAHGLDLRPLLFADDAQVATATAAFQDPAVQLPALLIVEHALAQLLMSWGVTPAALVGHSVGEAVAACVAGTMTFADCLGLVVLRGRLMARTRGGMLSVRMPAAELQPILHEFDLDLGVINAPDLCVASGTEDSLVALEARLMQLAVEFSRVRIDIAAHSRLLDPVLAQFRTYLQGVSLSAPRIPWVSNQSGTWITGEQATDPEYWVQQLRGTVDFAADIATVAGEHVDATFIEVGPGTTLCSLARLNPAVGARHGTVHTMRQAEDGIDDGAMLLTALGRLWALGGGYPVAQAYTSGARQRLSLPTYAFQEQRYFIEARTDERGESSGPAMLERSPADQWFWEPLWVRGTCGDATPEPTTYLVFADAVGIADQVIARLRAAGHRVAVVRAGDSYRMIRPDEYLLAAEHGRGGYEQLLADLVRSGYVPDRILNLALLAERPEFRPGHSFFHRNQELGFYNLVFLMQAWAAEGLRRPLRVVVATANAQKVVATDTVAWPEQATVLGPLQVLPHELPDLTCVAVDLSLPTPKRRSQPDYQRVVDAIVSEAQAAASGELGCVVAAWRDGIRLVRSYRHATPKANGAFPLRRGGVVLITGGLGGIGLTIARQLHETSGARLVLATRTPLPPVEQWPELQRTLDADHPLLARIDGLTALRNAGADVTVVSVDVTNIARMRDVIAEIRATHGGLHGVVHAAGVIDDRPLLEKEQVDIERVLAAKVYGTLVLDDLTRDHRLDFFVVFSSTSAITGPAGQLDYVAANAFLESFAQAHPDRVTSIAWGAWADAGLAVESVHRLLDDGRQRAAPCVGPLFATRVSDPSGEVTLTASWPSDVWFLDEHRTATGASMFPGAGYLELARQALREAGVHRPFELRELVMIAPLATSTAGPTRVQAILTPTDYGYSLEVRRQADDANDGEQPKWATTAQAQVVLRSPAAAAAVDVADALAMSPTRSSVRTRQQDHLRLGARWKVAQSIHSGPQSSVAVLAVPSQYTADLDGFVLHPALVDIGLCFALEQVTGYTGGALWVPISAQSVVVHHPDGPTDQLRNATAVATIRPGSSESAGFASFDVVFVDGAGNVAITVTGFTMKRLRGPLNLQPSPNESVSEPSASRERPISPAEQALRHNVSQGIHAKEGAEAFELALTAYAGNSLVITALDPLAMARQTDRISAAALRSSGESGVTFSRPRLNSTYVAPRDALERTLTDLWQELLGIDEVGVHDSFFDLGGHSLIAVRLFARIRKLFAVDLPISALFTADTVEAGAALIRSMLPTSDAEGAQTTTLPSVYKYLVPMHTRDERGTAPFFLVAGMFGNVLNLRHLSNQIGPDRPFYGLQARGLFGGDKPHETFEEMAKAYLHEVREVQPHGPYLLGGFSGGGITALEMARQLRAAGETVSLLVMLDTPAPSMRQPLTKADKIAIQLQNIARYKFGYLGRWWRTRQDWKRQEAARDEVAVPELGMQHSAQIEAAFLRALDLYDVGTYDGAITLYRPPHRPEYRLPRHRAIDVRRDFVQDDNGWHRHCAHVAVVEVPGDHDSMVLEPHVRVLAEALRSAIESAER